MASNNAHHRRDFSCQEPSLLLAFQNGTYPSVKVEAIPEVDFMLEAPYYSSMLETQQEGSFNAGHDQRSTKGWILFQEQTKSADQRFSQFDFGRQNFNESPPKKPINDKKIQLDSDTLWSQHQNFDCEACNKIFDNIEELESHLDFHVDPKQGDCQDKSRRFKCGGHNGSSCLKAYALEDSLQKHVSRYTNVRSKICHACGKEFEFASSLTRHKRLVHSVAGAHKCSLCDKEFLHKTSLDRHQLIHNKERGYKCEVCNKDFAYKDVLTSHKLTHSQTRDHKCIVCGKEFSKRANMVRHMLTHSKATDKICGVCGDAFSQRSTLNSHLRSHRNVCFEMSL